MYELRDKHLENRTVKRENTDNYMNVNLPRESKGENKCPSRTWNCALPIILEYTYNNARIKKKHNPKFQMKFPRPTNKLKE